MLVVNTGSQKQLFSEPAILDGDGFLSATSIHKIKEISRGLRAKETSLERITGVSIETWNHWLYKRRPPSGPALAFLTLFLVQPDFALETFEHHGKRNETSVIQ
jgi:DNA-binding transcriptional regulator YiaG